MKEVESHFRSKNPIYKKLTVVDNKIGAIGIVEFFDCVAEQCNHKSESYDCAEVEIAKNIQDGFYEFYKTQDMDAETITQLLLLYGPKVNEALEDNQIVISEDFFVD